MIRINYKKSVLSCVSGFLLVILIGGLLFTGCYVGNVWYETPEEALKHDADRDSESKGVLTVKELISKVEIDDIVIMTFVSQDDTLVSVTFLKNEKGLYTVQGYTEEVLLEDPTEFVATGDARQMILFPYRTYNNTVYGWCYASVTPVVNGAAVQVKEYEFYCQGKKQTLNYWQIDDFPTSEKVDLIFKPC